MSSHILITGANVGLGFESARQLANTGRWERVWISARSEAKAENAIDRLAAATELDKARFGAVVFDNNSPATVLDAIASLRGEDPVTTSLTRRRRAEYPFTTAHSHQVNHAPI